jgi:hypothetical protein
MKEKIFNIFLIDSEIYPGIIKNYSFCCHEVEGDDNFKFKLLQLNAVEDAKKAKIFSLPDRLKVVIPSVLGKSEMLNGYLSAATIMEMTNRGDFSVFDDAFSFYEAPLDILYVLTVQVNGVLILTEDEQLKYYKNSIA